MIRENTLNSILKGKNNKQKNKQILKNKGKQGIGILLIIFLLFGNITPIGVDIKIVSAAEEEKLFWNQSDTMDALLEIIPNKAGESDILLELDASNIGDYQLSYILEDGRETIVNLSQEYTDLKIGYNVFEEGTANNITEDLVNNSFKEMNYTLDVPDWEFIEDKAVSTTTGAIEYTINKSASSTYSGVAFEIDSKPVYIYWEFQSDKIYYLIGGYSKGTIMPIHYITPVGDPVKTKVLKGLENFEATPTQLQKVDAVTNKEFAPIDYPGLIKAGENPGLEIKFKQPKEYNYVTHQYDYASTDLTDLTGFIKIKEIANDGYIDFKFNLQNKGPVALDQTITSLPDSGVDEVNNNVQYDYDNYEYTIQLVKDKSELANQNTLIEWNELESSKIYNMNFSVEINESFTSPDYSYKFNEYLPESFFAYTYMEYYLKRANMTEANLVVKPYDVGSENKVEYGIYYSDAIDFKNPNNIYNDNNLWLRHYFTNTGSSEEIYIPVPFNSASSQEVYGIKVDFAGVDLYSQVLNYSAVDDDEVPPTTPRIQSIENIKVVPSYESDGKEPSVVEFDMTWYAPDSHGSTELATIFENGDVYPNDNRIFYEVLVNDIPDVDTNHPFKVIKIFELYRDKDLDGNVTYKLRDYTGDGTEDIYGEPISSNQYEYVNGYDDNTDQLRMDSIKIYDEDGWSNIVTTEIKDGKYIVTETNEPYPFGISNVDDPSKESGINYVRIRAITLKNGALAESYESIPMSLSLSLSTNELPIPEDLSYDTISTNDPDGKTGIKVNWSTIDPSDYEKEMLFPLNKNVSGTTYRIFITTDNGELQNINLEKPDSLAGDQIMVTPTEEDPLLKTTLTRITNSEDITSAERDALRAGNILYYDVPVLSKDKSFFSNIMELDDNTNYYFRMYAIISVDDDTIRVSELSDMISTTTTSVPGQPEDNEIKPLAVEDFGVQFYDDAKIKASLEWDMPEEISFEKDAYGFEVIAMEDVALAERLQSKDLSISNILNDAELSEQYVEGWRMYVDDKGTKFLKADREAENPDDFFAPAVGDQFEINVNHVTMVDSVNGPNRVYYYYVRTIKVEGDTVQAASAWQKGTLTTLPVQEPINLTVIYDQFFQYDDKHEVIVRFDAPIPKDGNLETEYVMEIFVKGEKDEDYTMTKYPYELLKDEVEGTLGYRQLTYKISTLESGKAYNVKVRIEDLTLDPEIINSEEVYPRSAFCERIVIRTEFEQEDYDKDNVYNKYVTFFREKAEKLLEKPYFVLVDDEEHRVVKYRDNYGIGELYGQLNGDYNLYADDLEVNTFYLPSRFLEEINTTKTRIRINIGDDQVMIRSGSMGVDITPEITEKADDIAKYLGNYKDYYVKVEVETIDKRRINDKEPVSRTVSVEITVMDSIKVEEDLDEMMSKKLASIIDIHEEDLAEELDEVLEGPINESLLLKHVEDALFQTEQVFGAKAWFMMHAYATIDEEPISGIAQSMRIQLNSRRKVEGIKGQYKEDIRWENIDASAYGSTYVIEGKDLTSYTVLPWDLEGFEGAKLYTQQEREIINKYNLTDIFSEKQLSDQEASIYRYKIIATVSTILGYENGYENNLTFLKNLNMDVHNSYQYSYMTKEDALYILTKAYGQKHQINLNSYVIEDYTMIKDMEDISEDYRETLLIGANMKLFSLDRGYLHPQEHIKIGELIDSVTAIDQGLEW